MEQGERIYVESLTETDEEYRELAKKYPNTYQSATRPTYFDSEFKWRYRMGKAMTSEEIKRYNVRFEQLKKLIKN